MGGGPRTPLASPLGRALASVARLLARYPDQAMVIGGIGVIARGVPRVTRDIDLAFSGREVAIAALVPVLASEGIEPRISGAIEFAEANQVFLARHVETGVDLDISRAWLTFELEALTAAEATTIAGVVLPIARAEDLVIYKAVAWRPQDQQDVERLLALHGDTIDLTRVRAHVLALGEALETDRLRELERVITRVLGPSA